MLPGAQINNRAHIYFDYNSAITTNTTKNKMHNDEDKEEEQSSLSKRQKKILANEVLTRHCKLKTVRCVSDLFLIFCGFFVDFLYG